MKYCKYPSVNTEIFPDKQWLIEQLVKELIGEEVTVELIITDAYHFLQDITLLVLLITLWPLYEA